MNLTGDVFSIPGRDDLEAPTQTGLPESVEEGLSQASKKHLRGLFEALIFASDHPIKANELAKTSSAQLKEVKEILDEMKEEYASRGVQLDEVAGGWLFRTSPLYAPFVRDLTKRKPVKLSRAQIETLAILAYRQPITRPEIDEIRGVDSGPVLKLLLERDLVRILGKKDEPGRPLLYGTTTYFLEFFGLKAIKDLPTLREFTELNEDSRRDRRAGARRDARDRAGRGARGRSDGGEHGFFRRRARHARAACADRLEPRGVLRAGAFVRRRGRGRLRGARLRRGAGARARVSHSLAGSG